MSNMWYVCDFFVRDKEAISNQIELLATHNEGTVVAAKRFMGQKALRRSETAKNIYVLPAIMYNVLLPMILLTNNRSIHYFEEEPSVTKRILFNMRKRPVYISMYRRPTAEYAEHLKKYRHLKKVFVELHSHKQILLSQGIRPELVAVSSTPAKIPRLRSAKVYDPTKVTIVFASWNNKEKNALHDRGILFLLDLLATNPHIHLVIPLRDRMVDEFMREAKIRNVVSRVELIEIHSVQELINLYDKADFVAFVAQARVTKDVPNSLVDGLMRGKPILISTAIDFHKTVEQYALGIVIPAGSPATVIHLDTKRYNIFSDNAYRYAARHTPNEYLKINDHYEV